MKGRFSFYLSYHKMTNYYYDDEAITGLNYERKKAPQECDIMIMYLTLENEIFSTVNIG